MYIFVSFIVENLIFAKKKYMAEQKIEKRRHNTNKQDKVNYAISEREDRVKDVTTITG